MTDDLKAALEGVRSNAHAGLADASDVASVESLRSAMLGRSGVLTVLLRRLREVPIDQRPAVGQLANELRIEIEGAIQQRLDRLRGVALDERLASEALDMSAPVDRIAPATCIH